MAKATRWAPAKTSLCRKCAKHTDPPSCPILLAHLAHPAIGPEQAKTIRECPDFTPKPRKEHIR